MGKHKKRQSGFTYLTILFAVAVAGVVMANTGIDWSQAAQREKERELLFVGDQYRQAIALYYQRTPGAIKRYPAKLEDLLTDTRYNPPQHYLRKLYRDPMMNQKQWGIVTAPEGGIMGVHSLSDAATIKNTNFGYADMSFEGTSKYSDWQFIYTFSNAQIPVPK
ncbi:MAG: type II secretion system protein [Gammaproteobacteria bacterium]|nr:type II secretion system protein [Gammaproteobacteria bacterium]